MGLAPRAGFELATLRLTGSRAKFQFQVPHLVSLSAAMLAAVPARESPAGGDCLVTAVVIPGVEEDNQSDGSRGVKASVGREISGRIRQRRRATRQAIAMQTSVATKYRNPPEADGGVLGSAEPDWVRAADKLPGVVGNHRLPAFAPRKSVFLESQL